MRESTKRERWEFDEHAAARMAETAWSGSQSFIHPRLARQIVGDYGITQGRCLDIGCGPARLTVELARITDLELTGLDRSAAMVEIARGKVTEHGLGSRVTIVEGAVEQIPFPDNHFDLIVSRGAMGFFEDKVRAFQEIYRVLKPGGHTYVGGGDARGWPRDPRTAARKLAFLVSARRRFSNPEWRRLWLTRGEWDNVLKKAGITDYMIHPGRFWIELRKADHEPASC